MGSIRAALDTGMREENLTTDTPFILLSYGWEIDINKIMILSVKTVADFLNL